MRLRSLWSRLGWLILVTGVCNGAGPTYKIAGHVSPAKRVRVSVTMVDHADRQASCITGEHGEFSFVDLPAAKYMLQVTDHGWSQLFQQSDEFSTAVVTGPDLDSEHIVFPLTPPARITGSVVDQDGDPVGGATVYLFSQSLVNGLVQTQLKAQVNSGADGDFHFTRQAPGTYYVAVTGRPWYAQNSEVQPVGVQADRKAIESEPHSDLDLAYPMVYYDGASAPDAATPLTLEAGASAEIHFTMHAVPALHIGVDGIQKQEGQQFNVQLSQAGPGGTLIPVGFGGEFGLTGVAPGSYVASSTVFGKDQTSTWAGSQPVTLTSDSTIHLSETAETSVKGQVAMDGGQLPASLAIWMRNLATGNPVYGFVNHDGTFEIPNILPGRYTLLFANGADLYMQSIKVKGSVYKNGELAVAKGAGVQLTITAAKGVTQVNGRAVSGTKAIGGAMVLLVPHDPNHGNYIPRDQSDSDGTFTLNWALPGRYTLIAIDNGRGLAYADPGVIASYLPGGQALDLPLDKDAKVEIEVQARK